MLTLTDLFCGAGGSSTGAVDVPGIRVRMAANHARHAVDTHQANHPDADHDCADLSQVDPRRYPRTDILWASPECTNHSIAKGRRRGHGAHSDGLFAEDGTDEAAVRSRATMHDVPRFAEVHNYRAIIVENVVDAYWWGPEAAPGAAFQAWLSTLHAWGYEHRIVWMNSMHAAAFGPPAPQSRDRMYVVLWRQGERAPDFDKWTRPWADCTVHGRIRAMQAFKRLDRRWGRYGKRAQYLWRCPRTECRNTIVEPAVRGAAEVIDWSLPAAAIGERKRPLAADTMRRVRAGFTAFAEPLTVPVEGREGKKAAPASAPLRTVTTRNETGLALPPYMVELRGGGSSHRSITAPLATVCASGNHHGLVTTPDLVLPYYSNGTARPASRPLPTVTTVDRHGALYGGAVASVEECRFRMLEPHEYAAAMAFPDHYRLLANDKRTRVLMLGNAVTPPAARDLVAMVAEAITGQDLEPVT
ncbi:DNA cytosine methyltransferase [Streptomyces lydicus]|uniref:DNA cytosine methyltransferase n=1 Tax=Streptomyces lydicus TaxID=47763 RepID=UPI000526CF8D|nr:DNA cytosine methyltransferase [Streptomyces lydicus]MDC7338942.1 DNA cytosine methyltransferase [Streptomyces lydicus]UEG91563.1 DNA cytosine methyltransferase [Streptomyces lydicus]